MQRALFIGGLAVSFLACAPAALAESPATEHETAVDVVSNGETGVTTQVDTEGMKPFTVVQSISFHTFKDASLTLTTPAAGAELLPGTMSQIAWEWQGDAISYVHLFYSKDGGAHYTLIAENVPNRGYYTWRVPDVVSSDVKILVQGSDLAEVFVEDVSDGAFTILGTVEYGTSPVDGTIEELTPVDGEQIVQSPSFSETYYVTDEGIRRPFLDTQSVATYIDRAEDVVEVSDATIASYTLGTPMLAKSGVVLIKETISPDVFWVGGPETAPVIRRLANETVAAEMYGADWADYVIDVTPTAMVHYTRGEDINHPIMVDTSEMKKRTDL